jgi:hypothetical protein
VTILGTNDPFVPALLLNLFKPTLKGPKLELSYPGAGHRIVF